jgi:hypothetical protein
MRGRVVRSCGSVVWFSRVVQSCGSVVWFGLESSGLCSRGLGVVEVPSRFEITDELWAEIEPLIAVRERWRCYPRRRAIDDRLALNGILHVLHTGITWEALPHEYGYGSGGRAGGACGLAEGRV